MLEGGQARELALQCVQIVKRQFTTLADEHASEMQNEKQALEPLLG
jgi:hypothetical protein